MTPTIRRIALRDIDHLHPAIAHTGDEIRHLLPADVISRAGVAALLLGTPIPVVRSGATVTALAESRLLAAARAYLDPARRITVLDWTDLDSSEDMETVIWSRAALHYLYTAHHPQGYPAAANAIRGAIPDALLAQWCPGIASARQFAAITGISRQTLAGPKKAPMPELPDELTPLDRIRRGVRHD